jgi:hypothetical protein
MGWVENLREPGTFKKVMSDGREIFLLVYVDDCMVLAPTAKIAIDEVSQILEKFTGEIVEPVSKMGNVIEMDFLGLQVLYNAQDRTLKIVATKAIERMRRKFNFQTSARKITAPAIKVDLTPTEQELRDLKEKPLGFPLRSLVGGLNYVAQTCRPDIAYAVNRCARYQTTPTQRVVDAAKRILRYLLNTANEGLEYSPKREREFNKIFAEIASEGNRIEQYGKVVQFSDADWAGCSTTLRSTSGSIHYLRGTAVHWHSKRQQLRAESTCESELYAAHDAIKATKSQGWLEWVSGEEQISGSVGPILFVDNRSLIDVAKQQFTSKKSKHIALRYMSVRDSLQSLCYVPTSKNLSDALTKPMAPRAILHPLDSTVEENDCCLFYCHACCCMF